MNVPGNDPSGFERRLASWLPAASALDRDRMLFEAGRASARAEVRAKVWPTAALGLALLVIGLGSLFARERSRRLGLEKVMAARTHAQAPALAATPMRVAPRSPRVERPDPSSYFVLTLRLAAGDLELPAISPESKSEHQPDRTRPTPPPLRPRGFERVLDL